MPLSFLRSLLVPVLMAGLSASVATAAPLTPPVGNPVIGGQVTWLADVSPTGEIGAVVDGDVGGPSVIDNRAPDFSGAVFVLTFDWMVDAPDGLFFVDGVSGDFDPKDTFLTGVLKDFGYDGNLITLVFGDLGGQAASLFGKRVLVSFFNFGALPQTEGSFDGTASYSIAPIAAVPLPLGGVLLLGSLGGLVLLQRRKVARERQAA